MKPEDTVLHADEHTTEKEKEIQAVMEEQMRILRDHVDTIIIRLSNQLIKILGKAEVTTKKVKGGFNQ